MKGWRKGNKNKERGRGSERLRQVNKDVGKGVKKAAVVNWRAILEVRGLQMSR